MNTFFFYVDKKFYFLIFYQHLQYGIHMSSTFGVNVFIYSTRNLQHNLTVKNPVSVDYYWLEIAKGFAFSRDRLFSSHELSCLNFHWFLV